jgi:hypothetical protein
MIDVCVVSRTGAVPKGVEHIPRNSLIIETSKPVGEARRRAIERVSTPVFAFIDDDIEVGPDWYPVLSQYMVNPMVGAVWGQHRLVGLGGLDRYLSLNQGYKELSPGERFNTNNSLIRLSAVKGWKPTVGLNCFEDLDLGNHIMRRGFKVIHAPVGGAIHRKGWKQHWDSSYWAGSRFREAYGGRGLAAESVKRVASPFTGAVLRGLPFGVFQGWVASAFMAGILRGLIGGA